MLFLVDAQLPPSLAEALRKAGCQAVHVIDIGLVAATDQQIWDEAISRSAVLVTKDRDFPPSPGRNERWSCDPVGQEFAGCSNRKLIELVLRALPAIVDAIERDEAVVEFVER